MPAPAPITADELERLRDEIVRARARGVRSVTYEGRAINYSTDSEMAAALADIERRLRSARKGQVRTIRFASSKGI